MRIKLCKVYIVVLHIYHRNGGLENDGGLISLSQVGLTTKWLFIRHTAFAVFARLCSAPSWQTPRACDNYQSSSVDTGHKSSHLAWGWFALIINLWVGVQISGGDRCTRASSETSFFSDNLPLADKTAVIVDAVAPENQKTALPESPWAILLQRLSRITSTSATRTFIPRIILNSFLPKAITLDISFKNPRRNTAII